MIKFSQINESVDKSGKSVFFIFLKIVELTDNVFIKGKNILDSGLFFHTDGIEDNQVVLHELELRDSMLYAFKIFNSISSQKLFYYFEFKDTKINYGFMNSTDKKFEVGTFDATSYFFKSLPDLKCLCNLDFIRDFNLKSYHFLLGIKKDFESFENGDVKVLNDKVMRMSMDRNLLPYEDDQLPIHLNYWVNQQSWNKKVYNYIDIEDDKVKFYIKVK